MAEVMQGCCRYCSFDTVGSAVAHPFFPDLPLPAAHCPTISNNYQDTHNKLHVLMEQSFGQLSGHPQQTARSDGIVVWLHYSVAAKVVGMTQPRRRLIDPNQTPYYHCVSRCVRRAFLCGKDGYTGKSFEHRRGWIARRLHDLAQIFAIDLCAYAVMSNHYHVVLRIDVSMLEDLTDEEVVERWSRLHRIPETFEAMGDTEKTGLIGSWRERLGSISWFMKSVNEPLARRANREDGCKGRFWEGRFRSQALLDETALLKCMVYVDLNPVRAGIAATPETSEHTSVQARIEGRKASLAGFEGEGNGGFELPMRCRDYLVLVDQTGRHLRRGKRGRIDPELDPILKRLQTNASWFDDIKNLTRRYCRAIGSVASLTSYRKALGQQRLRGLAG